MPFCRARAWVEDRARIRRSGTLIGDASRRNNRVETYERGLSCLFVLAEVASPGLY
jgi:hypothetical protein